MVKINNINNQNGATITFNENNLTLSPELIAALKAFEAAATAPDADRSKLHDRASLLSKEVAVSVLGSLGATSLLGFLG